MSQNGSYLVLFYITYPFWEIDGFSEKKARKYRMNRAFRTGQVTGFGRKTDGFWTGKGVNCLCAYDKKFPLAFKLGARGIKSFILFIHIW